MYVSSIFTCPEADVGQVYWAVDFSSLRVNFMFLVLCVLQLVLQYWGEAG